MPIENWRSRFDKELSFVCETLGKKMIKRDNKEWVEARKILKDSISSELSAALKNLRPECIMGIEGKPCFDCQEFERRIAERRKALGL